MNLEGVANCQKERKNESKKERRKKKEERNRKKVLSLTSDDL